ncbi:unnamed protein product [Prunus armeniaca]
MDGKGSASGSGSALPIIDLSALLGRRTLSKLLETENPFDNNKITPSKLRFLPPQSTILYRHTTFPGTKGKQTYLPSKDGIENF